MNDELTKYVREQFPVLKRKIHKHPIAYLDGPGGYQVPESVMNAVTNYFINMNANEGHQFETATNTSMMIHNARAVFADFLTVPGMRWCSAPIGPP